MLTLFSFSWSLVITGKDTDSEAPKRDRGAEQWPSPQSPPLGIPEKRSVTETGHGDGHWFKADQGNKTLLQEPYCKCSAPSLNLCICFLHKQHIGK